MSTRKLGRLPAQFPAGLGPLDHYVAGSLPKPPAKVAVPDVPLWGMLGNDAYGDCGPAGLEHGFMADAAATGLSGSEVPATDAQTVSYYLTYTGGQDTGVVLSQYLAYVRKTGFYGRKVDSYAPVAVHDVPLLQSAISLFDFTYTGITVTQQMQEDFEDGKAWTTKSLESPVDGGHCVPLVGYDDEFLYCVTWGGVQAITYPAWHYMSSEAWAVITGEFATANGDGRGVNLTALNADLDKLNVPSAPTRPGCSPFSRFLALLP